MLTTIVIFIIISFLAGAAALAAGVWLGGMVKRESALTVENDYLKEQIAQFKAEAMLAEGRIKLLEEARARLEQDIERSKKAEEAKGEIFVPSDDDGGTLGNGIEDVIGNPPDPGPLGDVTVAAHTRFAEQVARLTNPSTGENP